MTLFRTLAQSVTKSARSLSHASPQAMPRIEMPHISSALLADVKPVVEVWETWKGTNIYFVSNPFSPTNRDHLADVCTVIGCPSITGVTLYQEANIGGDFGRLAALLIKLKPSLKRLDVKNNAMQDGSVLSELVRYVAGSLSELDISSNPLGDEGVKKVADVLRVSTLSKQLPLFRFSAKNTGIGETGVRSLAEMLAVMPGLRMVSIQQNYIIEPRTQQTLVDAALSNQSRFQGLTIEGLNEKHQEKLDQELLKRARKHVEKHPRDFMKRLIRTIGSPDFAMNSFATIEDFVYRERMTLEVLHQLGKNGGANDAAYQAIVRWRQQPNNINALVSAVMPPQAKLSESASAQSASVQAAALDALGFGKI